MSVRRITATIALVAAAFGGFGASVAHAETIDSVDGPNKGCPIVTRDSNGHETVTYARTGERNGVLICRSNGEWSVRRIGQGNNDHRNDDHKEDDHRNDTQGGNWQKHDDHSDDNHR